MRKGLKKGFTLIELLVVIAIIAILATVVIINVAGARTKANDASVLNDLTNANKTAAACLVDGGIVNTPTDAGGVTVCSTAGAGIAGVWPALAVSAKPSAAWNYCTSASAPQATGCATFAASTATVPYNFPATSVAGAKYIILTSTGATKSGF